MKLTVSQMNQLSIRDVQH